MQVLQAFYGTVFLLDPQLKNLEIFKKMYLDLCKSFMLDLRALPAMKDVPDMEIKKMVLESRPI